MPKRIPKTGSPLCVHLMPNPLDKLTWPKLRAQLKTEEGQALLAWLKEQYQLEAQRVLTKQVPLSLDQLAYQTGWDMGRINLLQSLHNNLVNEGLKEQDMNPKNIMNKQNPQQLLGALRNGNGK
jgi:hypothetical protein